MLITSLNIRGFRSIRELTMENMGRAVILYGQNGAGKSNILAAIRALVLMARDLSNSTSSSAWVDTDVIRAEDFCQDGDRSLSIGMLVTAAEAEQAILRVFDQDVTSLRITIAASIQSNGQIQLRMKELELTALQSGRCLDAVAALNTKQLASGSVDADVLFRHWGVMGTPEWQIEQRCVLLSFLTQELGRRVFRAVPDLRHLDTANDVARKTGDVQAMLVSGDIKGAFAAAHQHVRPEVRDRFRKFRALLREPPLNMPEFDPVRLPDGRPDIQARTESGGAVSIDLAGLGMRQLFYIVASIALEPVEAVAIGEPEAHLHAPTSGRALRQLLVQLLDRGLVNQLFIATHSNLFDLDPEGYWHVERGEQGTTVERRTNLASIDHDHLYEPGPAKHALEDVLRLIPQAVVAHMSNGDPITGEEMIRMLQADTDEAMEYCKSVVRAAVRLVRIQDAGKA